MCFRKFDQWKLTRATNTFQSKPELDQSSKQPPNIFVKGRFLRVFSAIYAKDALKNLSTAESHYFELEIYLEKCSNCMWLEYFIDSSNLVPRASISFFITDIRYKKVDEKAPESRSWLSHKKTSCSRLFFWLQRGILLAGFSKYIVIELPVLFTPQRAQGV